MPVPSSPRRRPGVQQRTFRAFRDPGYRLLWLANLLSYTSRWMQMTILGWLVLQLTDSAWLVALVGFFGWSPMLILGLVGGLLADSADRKLVILSTQVASLLASIAMTLLLLNGSEVFWYAYPVAMVSGIAWALDMPSRRSAFHDLLGRSGVTNGVALDSVGMSVSRMLGPALAGVLIATAGFTGAYFVVVVSYSMAVALLLRFTVTRRARVVRTDGGVLSGLMAGLKYVIGHRTLRAMVAITVLMNLLMFPYTHLVPVIARDVLHVGAGPMGVLLASAGMGSLVGAVLVASAASIRYHGRLYMGGSALALMALLVFSFSEWYFVSLPTLLVLGLGTAGFSTMQASIVMLVARDDIRGKALGVVSLAIGASPFGALLEGAVAVRVSPGFALGLNAGVGLVCVALIGLLMPALRQRMRAASAQ